MNTGTGILIGGIIIAVAIVILYIASRKDMGNVKKIFSGLAIAFTISAILLIIAVWYLNNTKIQVEVKGDVGVNPSGLLPKLPFKLPGS